MADDQVKVELGIFAALDIPSQIATSRQAVPQADK